MKRTIGQKATKSLTITEELVNSFAEITGDYNPVIFNEEYVKEHTKFDGRVVHVGLTTALLDGLVATELPGPGTVFLSQTWQFTAPVYIGDTISAQVEVIGVHNTKPVTQLRARVTRQTGQPVLSGEVWCYTFGKDSK